MCLRFMVDLEINFLFLYLICFYLAYLASLFNSSIHLMRLIGGLVAPLIGYIYCLLAERVEEKKV
jgi:hypothetical protein